MKTENMMRRKGGRVWIARKSYYGEQEQEADKIGERQERRFIRIVIGGGGGGGGGEG